MTKRIFRSICLVALGVFFACLALIMGVLYAHFSNVQQAQLRIQTSLAAQGVAHEGSDYFKGLPLENYRITWIAADGSVLYDSESDRKEMTNHLEREEVAQAMAEGYGSSRRYSDTLMDRLLYCAQRLPDGTVLRLSGTQSSIFLLFLGMAQPICIVFAVALLLSVFFAVRLSRKIVAPLNDINLDAPLSNQGYGEIAPLLRRIDSQQRQLRHQGLELKRQKQELDTIVGSMNEGMILLNQQGNVVSMNPAAQKLLASQGAGGVGALDQGPELQALIAAALEGKPGEGRMVLDGGSYQLGANPILSEGVPMGVALFLFDVTEKERAEQQRRAFTANVSHELKTPLHAISGYAELMKNGVVKEADILPFAGRIYEETQRLVHLVEDIMSLSRLDEGAEGMARERVDLYQLAETVVSSLEPEAQVAQVRLELSGAPAQLLGVPQLLYSIVYNLCENAIKYNREKGETKVRVESHNGEICLSVSDTGIGIAPQDCDRIFERFYRVDKSRSKEVGGTGLGLSIVKHAARIHRASIAVDSTIGQGTTITVRFPPADAVEG